MAELGKIFSATFNPSFLAVRLFLFPWLAVSPQGNHFSATSHLMTGTSFKTCFELHEYIHTCNVHQTVMQFSSLLYFFRFYHGLSAAETAF